MAGIAVACLGASECTRTRACHVTLQSRRTFNSAILPEGANSVQSISSLDNRLQIDLIAGPNFSHYSRSDSHSQWLPLSKPSMRRSGPTRSWTMSAPHVRTRASFTEIGAPHASCDCCSFRRANIALLKWGSGNDLKMMNLKVLTCGPVLACSSRFLGARLELRYPDCGCDGYTEGS